MKKKLMALLLVLVLACGLVTPAFAADYSFTDRNGVERVAPEGSFATDVVSSTPGKPWTPCANNQMAWSMVGVPDYSGIVGDTRDNSYYNLGTGGIAILQFDLAIYDGEGEDIYVFETCNFAEPVSVEVSDDLETWYDVGTIVDKIGALDLNGKVPEGSSFRYVRLTDDKSTKHTQWPGADIDAVCGLNVKPISSDWTEPEIETAEQLGLIPDCLKNQDLTQDITRAEFATVAVKVYEALAGAQASPAAANPFTDTNDPEVLKAYNLGVVNGVAADKFAPNSLLNREQAAAMLTRTFKRVTMPGWTLPTDKDYPLSFVQPTPFADDAKISGYARESVYFMAANGIIKGVENNCFAPKNITPHDKDTGYANATREQALLIAVRMVENLK